MVKKEASTGANDLSALFKSAPDVSHIFN